MQQKLMYDFDWRNSMFWVNWLNADYFLYTNEMISILSKLKKYHPSDQ